MNIKHLDLNLLQALDALLSEQHVSRSAARLGVTQPSMSRNLARLRKIFDDELLIKTPSGYLKTPHAELIEKKLGHALSQVQLAVQPPTFDPAQDEHKFKIICSDYGAAVFLTRLLPVLVGEAPNAEFEVMPPSHKYISDISEVKADLLLVLREPLVSLPVGCRREVLFSDKIVCAMRRDHPLSCRELTLEAYLDYDHASLPSTDGPAGEIDETLGALKAKRTTKLLSPYMAATLHCLQSSDLVEVVPARIINALGLQEKITFKDIPFELSPVEFQAVWHSVHAKSHAHNWLRSKVREVARTFPAEEVPAQSPENCVAV